MSRNNRIYIPIIPYGLRQEETIVQIAQALQAVDCVVNDVFQQIEENIQRHRKYLSSLQKRSEVIAAKVDKLAGRNVITTVYSHHKFPFEGHNMDTLFKLNLKPLPKKADVQIRSKFQHAKYNKALNKLHFFHVKSNYDSSDHCSTETGLGDIPSDISCVDALFLFNTSHNLYENYVTLDPLMINEPKIELPEETNERRIADAPNSIINNQELQKDDYFNCFYTPAFEEVPNINVPTDLPDLPGIAGDLKFKMNIEAPIAPSKQSKEIDKSKSIDEITIADLPVITKPKSTTTKQTKVSTVAEIDFSPSSTTSETQSKVASVESNTFVPPPPPIIPPPPPMPEEPLKVDPITDSTTIVTSNQISSDNIHANLMEAIRKAGGKEKAKLRQVSQSDKIPRPESKESQEGLFMSDLYAALARRRKGISGLHKDDKNVSMMDRVSLMIEPPSPEESDNNDNDDDDNNDWDE